jgi:plastocyanin
MKKLFAVLVFLSLLTLVACGGSGSGSTGGGNDSTTVHLNSQIFVQSSVTIRKGSTITLVNDTSTSHILANGSWIDGGAKSMQEQGMPPVNMMQVSGSGNNQVIGPFNTPGTFHLYCVMHPGMNLTITVQ